MKPLVVVVLAVAMGGCGPARAPLADGAGPAAGAQAVLAAPYAPGGERGTPEVIRNGELMAEVAERMRAIGRAEGGLVTLESDQLRRILTAY